MSFNLDNINLLHSSRILMKMKPKPKMVQV